MPIQYLYINEKYGIVRYFFWRIVEKFFYSLPLLGKYAKRVSYFILLILSKIKILRIIIFKLFYLVPPKKFWNAKIENEEFNISHNKKQKRKRLLLLRPDHIGDFIYSIPSFIYVKDKFKDYSIELLVSPQNETLADSLKLFDVVHVASLTSPNPIKRILPSTEEYINLNSKLGKFEIVIDFRVDQDMLGLYEFLDTKVKYSILENQNQSQSQSQSQSQNQNQNQSQSQSQSLFASKKNQIQFVSNFSREKRNTFIQGNFLERSAAEALFNFVSYVHYMETGRSPSSIPYKKIVLRSHSFVKKIFVGKDLKDNYVVIAPEAGLEIKEWPKSKIINLVKLISKSSNLTNLKIVLLGKNKKFVLQGGNIVDLRGKTSLLEAVAIVKKAKFFIGFDSGLSHFAGLSGISSVIIFNGSTSSKVWAPINVKNNVSIFQPDISCSPCSLPKWSHCPNDRICSKIIQESSILKAFNEDMFQ